MEVIWTLWTSWNKVQGKSRRTKEHRLWKSTNFRRWCFNDLYKVL